MRGLSMAPGHAHVLHEGDYDAAEIDREIISARLKEDVVSASRLTPYDKHRT